jgi:hypothetical protein
MSGRLGEILKQAESLPADEQLELAMRLIERARRSPELAAPARKWMDVAGVAPHPLAGEDAQDWVSRTRQEGDDERGRRWRR